MPARVFISYSRHDTEYKDQLVRQLMVLERQGLLATWSDERIGLGGDWHSDLLDMLNSASVVILLITANFLTSEFILGEEVPRALEQRRGAGLKVVPVYCRPCAWEAVPWLARIQGWPRSAQPLWRNAGDDAASHLSELAHEIARMVGAPIPEAPKDEPASNVAVERRFAKLETLDLSALFASRWVRLSTYLLLFFCTLYLILFPRFIYGNCLVKEANDEDGDPYRGFVGVYVGPHMITVQMNEEGEWAVPLVSRLPKPVDLYFVYIENEKRRYSSVRLNFFSMMFTDRQTCYVTPGPRPRFKLAASSPPSSPGISFLAHAAYAQSQPPPARQGSTPQIVHQESVQDRLIATASEVLKLPPASLTPQSDLRKIFGADLVKSSQLVAALQREFQISIDNTAWDQLSTVEEIRRYIERKYAFFSGLDSEIDGALQRFLPHSRLYLSSRMKKIPDEKLANAKDSAKVPVDETIFGLLDGTLFGSAKEAILFGHRGVYFQTSWTTTGPRRGFIGYDELAIRNIDKESWSEVSLGGGQYFVVAGSDFTPEELVNILTSVQKVAQRRAALVFRPAPEAVVSAATVALHTRDYDKDSGTYVSIAINTASGTAFTWQDDRGEQWKFGSDKKITLKRVAELPLAFLENANIKICLKRAQAHGWRFDYSGNLFSGTEMALSFGRKGNEIVHGTGLSCVEEPLQ